MPRSPAGVRIIPRSPDTYSLPPGTTPQQPNSVISSSMFNAFANDVAQTFNTVQPILYGGTGAATAVGAADALSTQGTDITSAATTSISASTGRYVHITGTTTITSFGPGTAGVERDLVFDGSLTLTHNASSLILPGASNIVTSAGDTATAISEGGSNWRIIDYQRASGASLGAKVLATVATTSGTEILLTGIPADAKIVHINFNGVSTNAASNWVVQLGTVSTIENTGYVGSSGFISTTPGAAAGVGVTNGFPIFIAGAAAVASGTLILTLLEASSNTWAISGSVTAGSGTMVFVAGSKTISSTLTRIRLTTQGGADLFDAGKMNLTYIL